VGPNQKSTPTATSQKAGQRGTYSDASVGDELSVERLVESLEDDHRGLAFPEGAMVVPSPP
jgi:hypothetical protein